MDEYIGLFLPYSGLGGFVPPADVPPISRDLTNFPYIRRDSTDFVFAQRDKTDFE